MLLVQFYTLLGRMVLSYRNCKKIKGSKLPPSITEEATDKIINTGSEFYNV